MNDRPSPPATVTRAALAFAFLAAASPKTPSPGMENPLGQRGQWERVFTDEFDSAVFDPEHWTTCYWWNDNGCTNLGNNELQWYRSENVTVGDGVLRLTARREDAIGFEGRTFRYTSGMVTTGRDYEELPRPPRFATQSGYFEMRAKLPSGRGLWPAFWLLPSDRESKPEIDIMEVLGHRPNILEMHFHYRDEAGEVSSHGKSAETVDLSLDWHVFGLRWEPEALTWYLDGVKQWRYANSPGIPTEPMYLLINLAVGGDWAGDPDDNTAFPADLLVDYVRVWRQTGL